MKNCLGRFFLLFIIGALVMTTTVAYCAGAEFKGEMVLSDATGKVLNGPIFIKGVKLRQEIATQGMTVVTIYRPDLKLFWTLMPGNMYTETVLTKQFGQPDNENYTKVALGTKTINGYLCEGTKYIYQDKSVGEGDIWYAPKLNYAIKVDTRSSQGQATGSMEVKNIVEGPQADALFEVPPGYQKFVMPSGYPIR